MQAVRVEAGRRGVCHNPGGMVGGLDQVEMVRSDWILNML